jgi:hypothetical protein
VRCPGGGKVFHRLERSLTSAADQVNARAETVASKAGEDIAASPRQDDVCAIEEGHRRPVSIMN